MLTSTFVIASKSLGNNKVTNKMLKAILDSKYFLCIPRGILGKLIVTGRIEDTIANHFVAAWDEYMLSKKSYSEKSLEGRKNILDF